MLLVVIQWKGKFGDFTGTPVFCPAGSFVHGYQLEGLSDQNNGDDTALTGIQLLCAKDGTRTKTLQSKPWKKKGTYLSEPEWCSNAVVGFDVMSEGSQGPGDDTGLNKVDLYCKRCDDNKCGTSDWISAEVKMSRGEWKIPQFCSQGFAVVGLRTQHGVDYSHKYVKDDAGLTGVELYCDKFL